ncbi:hypothetical protein [endosymbiont of unidentified scaly snail isolate Monju]|uniref:hypothetical protein n=1 Tax=endosymbiont of unidentified scaly snail isolate Monju TaxID=1248727 RepID=UPI0003892694|nr:hypothetical protein [endosymbiont of unidentified scaly snail isolate Monju]BAN68616.1 hypothetical protein EBS_0663 [endosymbiont of unidentified scaly snail isolate Monju]
MKNKIGVVLALCLMGVAMPGMVLADEDKGGQAAEQAQSAEAMLQALLDQGMPVEKALKKVLEKYPEAAPNLIAKAVQAALAQKGEADKTIEKIVKVAQETLGEGGEQAAIAQGLLLAGVDPEPYLEATAAGKKDKDKKKKKKKKDDDNGNDDNGNDGNTDTGTGGGLPGGGGGGGGGGGVSPS